MASVLAQMSLRTCSRGPLAAGAVVACVWALNANEDGAHRAGAAASSRAGRGAQNLKLTPLAVKLGRKAVLARVGSQFSQRL